MKAKILIIYDSLYGNTEKIAHAIFNSINSKERKVIHVNQASINDLNNLDLLIVGSPTQGGRPTQNIQSFLDKISKEKLKNIKIASFDTRFLENKQNFALKLLMKTIGYAAPKIQKSLVSKGAIIITEPFGFIVENTKGPLSQGELEKAKFWTKTILKKN